MSEDHMNIHYVYQVGVMASMMFLNDWSSPV